MDQPPIVSIAVECLLTGDSHVVTAAQVRAVYFPTNDLPHLVYLCPGCNDAHRYRVPVEYLDELRKAGAPSDYPDIPDHPDTSPAE